MTYLLAGHGSVWIQPGGPGTKTYYLGTFEIGDVSRSRGDLTLFWCPDRRRPNRWQRVGFAQGEPGPVTVTLSGLTESVASWMETVDCPMPVYVSSVTCGRRGDFATWSRLFVLDMASVVNEGMTGLVARTPANQAETIQSYDLAAPDLKRVFRIDAGSQLTGLSSRTALAVSFVGGRCAGDCGPAKSDCEEGYLGLLGAGGSPSNVYVTTNGGMAWGSTLANPFHALESVSGLACSQISPTAWQVMAARGTADGGNPMEIARSTDRGLSWSNVDVGSVNGQYAIGRGQSLWSIGTSRFWLATTGGYVYSSGDNGVTWSARHPATLTVSDLYCVHFTDDLFGLAGGRFNTLIRTVNGGTTWTMAGVPAAAAGQTITGVWALDSKRWWLCYNDARLYRTADGGLTWREHELPISGTGSFEAVEFSSDYCGWLLHQNAAGTVGTMYRTVDGGWSWQLQVLPSGTKPMFSLFTCGDNIVYAAGEI